MIATSDRENTWFAVREIAVNRPVEVSRPKQAATVDHQSKSYVQVQYDSCSDYRWS